MCIMDFIMGIESKFGIALPGTTAQKGKKEKKKEESINSGMIFIT